MGVMPTVVKRPGHGANTPPGLSPATVPPRQSNRTPPLVRGRLDLPDCPFRSDGQRTIGGQRRKPRIVSFHGDISPLDVNQTPIRVTPSPANMTIVSGSPNNAQAQIMVTGGLR